MADTRNRVARIQHEQPQIQTLTVTVPSKVTPEEFGFIQKDFFERIRCQTGCPACLSGRVRIVAEEDFAADVITVKLN